MEAPTVRTTPSSLADNDVKVKELKEFDETKAGVKGLMDSGLSKIPKIFHCPPLQPTDHDEIKGGTPPQFPVINLQGLDDDEDGSGGRKRIVEEISRALETWGFFQIINHGVPIQAMDKLMESIKKFHELPNESKMEFYSRDHTKKVRYYSTGDLYLTKIAQWKDSLSCDFEDDAAVDSESLPSVCREAISEYINCMAGLRKVLSELLSEALGLESEKLGSMECMDISRLLCHYYPACPEPELTQGIVKHSDPFFLTILLQDGIGGLQVYYDNQWVDVPPVHGSFIINAGDMLQLVSNDKFISVEHRVKVARIGPRISAACFLYPGKRNGSKLYGPLKELVSENNNPPKYRETTYKEYIHTYAAKGLDGIKSLPLFKYVQSSHPTMD